MAMVLTLMIVARKVVNLQNYITLRHIDVMCKLIILTSSIVALAYGTEFFTAQYSGNLYEKFVFLNRAFRALRLGLLDDGELQRARSPVTVVPARTGECDRRVRNQPADQRRDVVRTVRHYRDQPA